MRSLNRFFLFVFIFSISACGVKGDPLPPEDAPKLGRGTPTYSNAVENIDFDGQVIEKEEDEDESEKF